MEMLKLEKQRFLVAMLSAEVEKRVKGRDWLRPAMWALVLHKAGLRIALAPPPKEQTP